MQIDPPYNTGSAFEYYDDNFEHSIWLGLMYPRLKILKNLLSNTGLIFVQIDDNEQAYLKVIMDEIMGRNNFITTICVKMSTASGVKTSHRYKTIIKEKEMILVYAKDKNQIFLNPQYTQVYEWDDEFQYYLEKNNSDNPDDWVVKRLKDVLTELNLPSDIDNPKTMSFIDEHKDVIWRRAFIRNEFKKLSQDNPNKVFINKTDKMHYYYRGREMFFLADKYHECYTEDGIKYAMSNLLGDFWVDINTGKLFSEGGVEFRNSKKPEFLVSRILQLTTNPNDLVLDSFLGSGTTAAVANKMGRKWIGIELGDHCYTHCIPRLNNVIDGNDSGGITSAVNWQSGGGYKFYELAPSFIEKDKYGNDVISNKYNASMLIAAVAKLNGYYYAPDNDVFWKQGHSQDKSYIYVTTEYLTVEMLDNIAADISPMESLLICTPAFDIGLNKMYDNIQVKKIPQSVLDKCKYGVDNYNLNIIDVPELNEEEWEDD